MRCAEVVQKLPHYLECVQQHGQGFADSTYLELRVHLDKSQVDNLTTEFGCRCYPEYQRLLRASRPLQPVELHPVVVEVKPVRKPLTMRHRVALLAVLGLIVALLFILLLNM